MGIKRRRNVIIVWHELCISNKNIFVSFFNKKEFLRKNSNTETSSLVAAQRPLVVCVTETDDNDTGNDTNDNSTGKVVEHETGMEGAFV